METKINNMKIKDFIEFAKENKGYIETRGGYIAWVFSEDARTKFLEAHWEQEASVGCL